MPRRFLLSDLKARCRQRVSLPASGGPIPTEQLGQLISERYGDLFSIVCDAGLSYFETAAFLTTVAGTAYVSEPAGHLSTVGIDYIIDAAGRRRPLRELMTQERAQWSGQTGSEARRYALIDDRIYLYPTPSVSSSTSYEIRYIPQPPDLATFEESDPVDVVTPDGEGFLVWGVAVLLHGILETDAQLAMIERDKARERLADWAMKRAFNTHRHAVVDEEIEGAFEPSDWMWR